MNTVAENVLREIAAQMREQNRILSALNTNMFEATKAMMRLSKALGDEPSDDE